MNKVEYRALLDALMVSDPWPDKCFEVLEAYANVMAVHLGYQDWIVAYHELKAN